jgi:hypothetical protein
MLQNAVLDIDDAVLGIDELRSVKNTADLMSSSSGRPLDYEAYCSLLLAAAAADDEQYKPKKSKRQVFYNSTYPDDGNQGEYEHEDTFDMDYPASSLQAYATNFCSKTPMKSSAKMLRMSAEKSHSLDYNSKAIWDRLDDTAKAVILGYKNDEPSSLQPRVSYTGSSLSARPPT